MFNSNSHKFEGDSEERNPVVIGAVSAAAGIALGTAAAMYLSKKDNRKKLMDSLEVVRGRAQSALKTLVSKAEDTTDIVLSDTKKILKDAARNNKTLNL